MAKTQKRAFDLPPEEADFIDRLVNAGAYASASDVISAGLRVLQDQNNVVERWLREDVASAYDALKDDPGRAIPAETVFARLRAHHETRLKSKG